MRKGWQYRVFCCWLHPQRALPFELLLWTALRPIAGLPELLPQLALAKERLDALDVPLGVLPVADAVASAQAVAFVRVALAKAVAALLAADRTSLAVKAVPAANVLDIAVALTRLEIAIE